MDKFNNIVVALIASNYALAIYSEGIYPFTQYLCFRI